MVYPLLQVIGSKARRLTVSRGSLSASGAVEKVGIVRMISPPRVHWEPTSGSWMVQTSVTVFWFDPTRGYSTASGRSPVSIFFFFPTRRLFLSFGLLVWPCKRLLRCGRYFPAFVFWFDPTGGVSSKVATSSMSIFWFDPTGGVCSKVATSSMSVFRFDPTRGFCIVSANILAFGLLVWPHMRFLQ